MDEPDDPLGWALGCLLMIVAMGLLMLMYYHGPQIADMILGARRSANDSVSNPPASTRAFIAALASGSRSSSDQPVIVAVVVVAVASAFVACLLVSAHQVRRP